MNKTFIKHEYYTPQFCYAHGEGMNYTMYFLDEGWDTELEEVCEYCLTGMLLESD